MAKHVSKILFISLIAIAYLATPLLGVNISQGNNLMAEEPYAVMILDNGRAYPGETITLSLVISNPTIFNLVNATLYIKFPVKTVFIGNQSNYATELNVELTGENAYNVTIKIPLIPINSTYRLNISFSFPEKGSYVIRATDITAYEQKGEFLKKITILMNKEIGFTITEKKESPYPPEGTEDATWIIALFTILLPLGVLSVAHKFAWKAS